MYAVDATVCCLAQEAFVDAFAHDPFVVKPGTPVVLVRFFKPLFQQPALLHVADAELLP